jgi:hypothetical protein
MFSRRRPHHFLCVDKNTKKSNLRSITLSIINITLNKRPYLGDLNDLIFVLFGLKLVEKHAIQNNISFSAHKK